MPESGGNVESQVRYQGRRRDGGSSFGSATPADLVEWVKSFYTRGFRTLTVSRGGIEVGGISVHQDTGKRTWWAEQSGRP